MPDNYQLKQDVDPQVVKLEKLCKMTVTNRSQFDPHKVFKKYGNFLTFADEAKTSEELRLEPLSCNAEDVVNGIVVEVNGRRESDLMATVAKCAKESKDGEICLFVSIILEMEDARDASKAQGKIQKDSNVKVVQQKLSLDKDWSYKKSFTCSYPI